MQMQRTWNIFSFLIHGFLLHGLKTGENFSNCCKWLDVGKRGEPDDCHVTGGRSMTWSFDFGGVWDMLLGGKSDTLSVQVWPVGIEDCIALPVEGEEWDLEMDSWGYSGEDLWLWSPCLMPMPLPWHLRDMQQGCIVDGLESFYSFSLFSISSTFFLFLFFFSISDFQWFPVMGLPLV